MISSFLRRKGDEAKGQPKPQVRDLSPELPFLNVIAEFCERGGRFSLTARSGETSYSVLVDRGGPFNVHGDGLSGTDALVAAAKMTSGTCTVVEGWPVAQPLYQHGLGRALRTLIDGSPPPTAELPAPRGVEALRRVQGIGEAGTLQAPDMLQDTSAMKAPASAFDLDAMAPTKRAIEAAAAAEAAGEPMADAPPSIDSLDFAKDAPRFPMLERSEAPPGSLPYPVLPTEAEAPAAEVPVTHELFEPEPLPRKETPEPVVPEPESEATPAPEEPSEESTNVLGEIYAPAPFVGEPVFASAAPPVDDLYSPPVATPLPEPDDRYAPPADLQPIETDQLLPRMREELVEADPLMPGIATASEDQSAFKHRLTQAILWLVQVDEPERYTLKQARGFVAVALADAMRSFARPFRRHASVRWQRAKADWEHSGRVVERQRARRKPTREIDADPRSGPPVPP